MDICQGGSGVQVYVRVGVVCRYLSGWGLGTGICQGGGGIQVSVRVGVSASICQGGVGAGICQGDIYQ